MSDAWSYLKGSTGDAWERLGGTSGDTWERLYGDEGDAWERLTADTGGDVYIDAALLRSLTFPYSSSTEGGSEQYPFTLLSESELQEALLSLDATFDADKLSSETRIFLAERELETNIRVKSLLSKAFLWVYDEIQLGHGAIITCGFIDGNDVTIFPPDTPWTPMTDPGDQSLDVDHGQDVDPVEGESRPISPQIETGPILNTVQIGSQLFSVAVYGDAIYVRGIGSHFNIERPELHLEQTKELSLPLIEAKSSPKNTNPYAWNRRDQDVLLHKTFTYSPQIFTDCVVKVHTIQGQTYGFMCRIDRWPWV